MLAFAFIALTFAETGATWHDDYAQAYQLAKEEKKDLFICFTKKGELDRVLQKAALKEDLKRFVCVRVPLSYEYKGKRLLDQSPYREMMGKPGLAMVSLRDPKADYYREVVSAHPLVTSRYSWVPSYGVEQIKTILNLPPGSLGQRSMIYAVKVHPERPRSVYGRPHRSFLKHAERHCERQASAQYQHHADIIAASNKLESETGAAMGGASEVVAESWGRFVGGENVLEAAFSCVDAWRQSPGHWGAVSRPQNYFGYDIAKGANGTWYATGIFAR